MERIRTEGLVKAIPKQTKTTLILKQEEKKNPHV